MPFWIEIEKKSYKRHHNEIGIFHIFFQMRAYFGILEALFKDILCKSYNSKLYSWNTCYKRSWLILVCLLALFKVYYTTFKLGKLTFFSIITQKSCNWVLSLSKKKKLVPKKFSHSNNEPPKSLMIRWTKKCHNEDKKNLKQLLHIIMASGIWKTLPDNCYQIRQKMDEFFIHFCWRPPNLMEIKVFV